MCEKTAEGSRYHQAVTEAQGRHTGERLLIVENAFGETLVQCCTYVCIVIHLVLTTL